MSRNGTQSNYEKRIYHAQDYIEAHLDKTLNLETLARMSAFSPCHFHRVFKRVTRETPCDFIQRVRLEKACSLLSSDPEAKIIGIALDCGFETPSSFAKAFKKRYGLTPSEYRDSELFKNSMNGTYSGNPDQEQNPRNHYTLSEAELKQRFERRKSMKLRLEVLPEYRLAYLRRIGPYGADNVPLMRKLKQWAIDRNLLDESSVILGIAHDDPKITPPEHCRYDTCMVIPEHYPLGKEINENRLPGGQYAVIPVKHTAEAITEAWKEIFSDWLPESGYRIDQRPVFERYTGIGPGTELVPAACEICIPVTRF